MSQTEPRSAMRRPQSIAGPGLSAVSRHSARHVNSGRLTCMSIGASIPLFMHPTHRQLAALGLFWPALAFEYASEFASAMTRQFANRPDDDNAEGAAEPRWTNPNQVTLELGAVRLREFFTGSDAEPTLICAPFALHGATIVDFAPQH